MTVDPVKTLEEAFAVALIRNECRLFLTGNRKAITTSEQEDFFVWTPSGITLYIVRSIGVPCGYALIRKDGKRRWITGCITKRYRGIGLGRRLFMHLRRAAGNNAVLSVLRSNKRAIRLYRSLGFVVYRKTQKLLYMRLRK